MAACEWLTTAYCEVAWSPEAWRTVVRDNHKRDRSRVRQNKCLEIRRRDSHLDDMYPSSVPPPTPHELKCAFFSSRRWFGA